MSVLAFARATTSGTDVAGTSPDVTATSNTLTNFANAVVQITAYSHAVLNTDLTPVDPNNEPSWFSTLSGNLTNIKSHAQDWVNTIGPSMTQVPQAIINFDNTFTGQYNTIMEVINMIGINPPTPQQKKDLLVLMGQLYSELQSQQTTINGVNTSLVQYNDNLTNDHTALTTGSASITNAIQDDKDAVINLNTDISNLQLEIAQWSKIATASEIGIGVSFFAGLVGVFVTIGTAGVGVPILIGSVVGLGGSIAGAVVANLKINAANQQITNDTNTISADNQQIVILNSVASSVTNLVTTNETAANAMSDVLTTWDTLTTKLGSVISDLETAEGDIGSILDAGDLQTTKTAWTQLMNFATNMQQALGNITLEPVTKIPAAA